MECNYNPDTKALMLCPDMARQLNRDNAGHTFQMVYIEDSPAIVCDFDKDLLSFCPFCGQKLRWVLDPVTNQWR